MSSTMIRLCGLWTAFSAVHGVGITSQAKSTTSLAASLEPDSDGVEDLMRIVEVDPTIHGPPGHQWEWVKNAKGDWTRRNVPAKEAAAVAAAKSNKPDPAAAATNRGSIATSVNIDVYYETRCPGCLLFINKTLEPLWRNKALKNVLNVTMVTYGNGMTIPIEHISEGYKFWHPETTGKGFDSVQICQHGSDECLGNLVQVCAKDVASHDQYMELIFCMAATSIQGWGEEKSTFECMQKHKIDAKKVKECTTSPRGNELINAQGKVTHSLKGRLGTPWVMIAGEHVADQLLINGTLLLQSVCSHVGNVPVACAPWHKAAAAPAKAAPAENHDDDFQVFAKDQTLLEVSKEHV